MSGAYNEVPYTYKCIYFLQIFLMTTGQFHLKIYILINIYMSRVRYPTGTGSPNCMSGAYNDVPLIIMVTLMIIIMIIMMRVMMMMMMTLIMSIKYLIMWLWDNTQGWDTPPVRGPLIACLVHTMKCPWWWYLVYITSKIMIC
jgi:hypothetical protein